MSYFPTIPNRTPHLVDVCLKNSSQLVEARLIIETQISLLLLIALVHIKQTKNEINQLFTREVCDHFSAWEAIWRFLIVCLMTSPYLISMGFASPTK